MDAWSTVIGQRTMESINSIAQDVDKIGRNYPTLRDQFAMSAMNAIVNDIGNNSNLNAIVGEYGARNAENVARAAYKLADAMLAERNKK